MRPLTENGEWGAKQKKIYDLDENGEKIPVIDKKTGQQIIKNNMLLEQAKEMLMLAKQELHSAQYATYKSTQIKNTAVSVKNEVMEMIAKVKERKGRLRACAREIVNEEIIYA